MGEKNTPLHLAAIAGKLQSIKKILSRSNHDPAFVKAQNGDGNTALHEAAGRDHWKIVEELLRHDKDLLTVENKFKETALFIACQGGHFTTVKKLLEADSSSTSQKVEEIRRCLHVIVNRGDSRFMREKSLQGLEREADNPRDTALHLAARGDLVDLVKQLLALDHKLCYEVNHNHETPLYVAVKFGFLGTVKALIEHGSDCLETPSSQNKNVLHLAVALNRVKIVDYLVNKRKEDLSQLINQRDDPLHIAARKKKGPLKNPSGGDTPLHIAARKKHTHMVELLLKVPGVNKNALNKEGFTPLDIAREVTQYDESYNMIGKLATYPPKSRPFMYNAPKASQHKYENVMKLLDVTFKDRRNTELVVAVLLATIAFTALFTIPGGFQEDPKGKGEVLGTPVLIPYRSFKIFLIFDCLAFFLSLFVVYMWQMSSPLTMRDKMLFMCINNVLLIWTFAFTAYGFMAALYAVLAHKEKALSWAVLGTLLFIVVWGNFAFFYQLAKFAVTRARLHRLCGVPCVADDIVEDLWVPAERLGILDVLRKLENKISNFLSHGSLCLPGSNRKGAGARGIGHEQGCDP